jgi:hypothetical protein
VLVDTNHPLMQPVRDPVRSFVFHAADRAVHTVLVDGEVVLKDGEPVHLDAKAAMAKLAEAQARMIRDAPKIDYAQRPGDQISPLVARGSLMSENRQHNAAGGVMIPGMEILDREACYRVFQTHDARFDGRIFVGVTSTNIYCRPICPARTPKFENCRYFASAAAAQEAGFRPCLRCRPETRPSSRSGAARPTPCRAP